MSLIEALIFGIVQGLTEFLPISSTAHIVITELLFGYSFPGLGFEIFLHIASIFAVILYFRRDLWAVITGFFNFFRVKSAENRVHFLFGLYIITATVITGIAGFLLKSLLVDAMKTPSFIAGALVATGTALIFIERLKQYGSRKADKMTFIDAIVVGLAQTVSVLPGISRSGATLVAGLWLGLERETAVRYSFLLAIPVILGSTALAAGDISGTFLEVVGPVPLMLSFLATFIFSLVGIIWLINFLKRGRLIYFAIYCYLLAILVLSFVREIPPTA